MNKYEMQKNKIYYFVSFSRMKIIKCKFINMEQPAILDIAIMKAIEDEKSSYYEPIIKDREFRVYLRYIFKLREDAKTELIREINKKNRNTKNRLKNLNKNLELIVNY